jgi:hypothetical protein
MKRFLKSLVVVVFSVASMFFVMGCDGSPRRVSPGRPHYTPSRRTTHYKPPVVYRGPSVHRRPTVVPHYVPHRVPHYVPHRVPSRGSSRSHR